MPLRGVCWFLCCRQGFSLLGLEYGEREEEESFELRNKDDPTCNGPGQLEVTISQPVRSANGTPSLSGVSEEKCRLMAGKVKTEEEPDVLVKGWLLRDVQGGWLRQKRFWFTLSSDSLDCYSGSDRETRLGTLVLTSLCTVLWPDKLTYKQTGYWSLTVYGRKHCYKLFTKHFNEAVHWACAIQKVIDSKAPVETPTQVLIRDIEENMFNPEVVEHIYQHNPILTYTQSPLYAPLLPFPYGSLDGTHMPSKGYTSVREEAVRLFHCLQQLESSVEPVPLIQGILQTCLDLRPLRDELYCQLIKQTSGTQTSGTQTSGTQTSGTQMLCYWQLLTCMSCTFLPSSTVLRYLRFHLKRVQSVCVDSEVESYATFITQALGRTRCRECVPSWEEIQGLMVRQDMECTVYYPGTGSCSLVISSHTTANEVVRKISERLGLQDSCNTFSLFEQTACYERAIAGGTIIADVITRFENLSAKDSDSQWRLCFKLYCLLDTDNISADSIEYLFLYEQCHEMVVRGQLPVCEDDLLSLAALRLQALRGDYSPLAPCPPLEQLLPARVLEARALPPPPEPPACPPFAAGLLAGALWGPKRREEQDRRLRERLREEASVLTVAVLERWKVLAGYGRADSMAAYLTIARQWSGFGCTLYEVDFYISSTGSFSQRLWLGVAASCVSLYRQGEPEALESLPITQICSYGVSDSNTFRITAGDRDLLFETTKLAEIMQLMNAYFSASQRQLGKDDCITMETTHKLRPSLLELPSHPV